MAKKLKKAKKPSDQDLARKAKRTGYRFKTEGNPKLHKKDGELNAKGKELYFKTPKKEEIQEFKRNADGSFDNAIKQVYHERRADRTHSDDNTKSSTSGKPKVNKGNYFEEGGEAKPLVEKSVEDMKAELGREPKYPYDFIDGKKYEKCFLRPFYKCVD